MSAIAETNPKRMSNMGDMIRGERIINNGLLGGVLSVGWPLLDIRGSKAMIKYHKTRIDGREFHELDYSQLHGGLVTMYFDLDTYRHVMTEYRGYQNDYVPGFVLLEKFDNFKEVDGVMLPFNYTLSYSSGNSILNYSFDISQLDHNLKIDPQFYKSEELKQRVPVK